MNCKPQPRPSFLSNPPYLFSLPLSSISSSPSSFHLFLPLSRHSRLSLFPIFSLHLFLLLSLSSLFHAHTVDCLYFIFSLLLSLFCARALLPLPHFLGRFCSEARARARRGIRKWGIPKATGNGFTASTRFSPRVLFFEQ